MIVGSPSFVRRESRRHNVALVYGRNTGVGQLRHNRNHLSTVGAESACAAAGATVRDAASIIAAATAFMLIPPSAVPALVCRITQTLVTRVIEHSRAIHLDPPWCTPRAHGKRKWQRVVAR
jgi:hypothetical protein